MDKNNFNTLLLNTAFSCMACDGDIDKKEIQLIRQLHKNHKTFGDIDINNKLDFLLKEINLNSKQFLQKYFLELTNQKLSEPEELKILEVAIDTIKADDKIEYSEIKFFKIIRSKLNVNNDIIAANFPDFEEFLEDDIITDSYMSRIQNDFLNTQEIPQFKMISIIEDVSQDNNSKNAE